MKTLYTYNCKYRPAGIGAIPKRGVYSLNDNEIVGNGYGTVTYDRKLTDEEVRDYELELVRMEVR